MMLESTAEEILVELADREAIRDCLYRYARGIDRCDKELIASAYWPDATDDHLWFSGTRDEFIAWSIPEMQKMDQNVHIMANIFIRFDDEKRERAKVESYMYGIQRLERDGAMIDIVAAGRYLDFFEKREGKWRISRRLVMTDWFREYPDSANWDLGPFGMGDVPRGKADTSDHSYNWLGLV